MSPTLTRIIVDVITYWLFETTEIVYVELVNYMLGTSQKSIDKSYRKFTEVTLGPGDNMAKYLYHRLIYCPVPVDLQRVGVRCQIHMNL